MMFRIRLGLILLSVMIVAACGCGGGDGVSRQVVSGNVTFDGQPLAFGEIIFRPETGPEGSATVRNGTYTTTAQGSKGVLLGTNTLYITAYPSEPPSVADETVATEGVPPLFIAYQMKVDVLGATCDITIPADAKGHGVSTPAKRSSTTREP